MEFVIQHFGLLVQMIGFPAVVCLGLLWYIYKQAKWHREDRQTWQEEINDANDAATKVVRKATEAINSHNAALQRVSNVTDRVNEVQDRMAERQDQQLKFILEEVRDLRRG